MITLSTRAHYSASRHQRPWTASARVNECQKTAQSKLVMTLVLFFKLSMIQSFWFPICALSLLPCITQSTETWLCLRSPSFSHSMWCVKRTPPSCPIPTASLSHLDSIGSYPLTAVSSFTVLLCTKWVCSTSLLLNHQMKPCTRKMRLQILSRENDVFHKKKYQPLWLVRKKIRLCLFFFSFFWDDYTTNTKDINIKWEQNKKGTQMGNRHNIQIIDYTTYLCIHFVFY